MPVGKFYTPYNVLINGDFGIWQTGTSIAHSVGTSVYTADQWGMQSAGGEYAATVTRDTNAPTVAQAKKKMNFSHLVTTTTPETALATTDYLSIVQPMIGESLNKIAGNVITVSFWTYTNHAGTYCMFLSNGASTYRSYVETFACNAGVWERQNFIVEMDDLSNGTWNTTTGLGLLVGVTLSAGSTYDGTDKKWQTADYRSVNSCTNTFMTTASTTFAIAGAQLVNGAFEGNSEPKEYFRELEEAERFYQKSYNPTTDPGTVTDVGNYQWVDPVTAGRITVDFHRPLRAIPTMTWYSPATGASGKYENRTGATGDYDASTWAGSTGTGSSVMAPSTSGAANDFKGVHWVADARLTI